MPHARSVILLCLCLLVWLAAPAADAAGKKAGKAEDAEPGGSGVDEFLNEVETANEPKDLDLLADSHLSDLARWRGVRPARIDPSAPPVVYPWQPTGDGMVSPLHENAATTNVQVSRAGEYRVWLRYIAKVDKPQPVKLSLTGTNNAEHVFAARGLTSEDGKSQERKSPIRFEADYFRMSAPAKPIPIWEYWDVSLQPGMTTLSLSSAARELKADSLFITRSKQFKPSLIADPANATLNRTYYRFRVAKLDEGKPTHTLAGSLTYHWGRPPPRGGTEPIFYYPFFESQKTPSADGKSEAAVGEWSAFIDVTDGISSPGPWATASIAFGGVTRGQAEIQIAFAPYPGAVMKTVSTGIANGVATILIPIDSRGITAPVAPANDEKAVAWGLRTPEYLRLLETTEDVFARHLAYAKAGLASLPRHDNPAPRLIRISTGNGAAPAVRDRTTRMLASIGINSIEGAGAALRDELGIRGDITLYMNDSLFYSGSHDPTDPLIDGHITSHFRSIAASLEEREPGSARRVTTLKLGDEIGAIVGANRINLIPDCKAVFHDHLRKQLAQAGRDASFFGVGDVSELDFNPSLAPDAGRFERRLYYQSARFNFVFTSRFYERLTRAAEKVFPNVRTYCNFSPHPPMFGQQMNGSDWFALSRERGATMAWAEDWAGVGGGWGFAGIQTVSYYAAMVECAARRHALPSGFYVVTTMGAADRKMFCLAAHGVFDQHIYSFGPRYAGAEFSNFWDERADAYGEVARGAFALGPADLIIHDGKRQPRRVALLYNRSHEIWNGGFGGFQSDRLLTFIALRQAHIPVDIILEEDLTPELLAPYRAVYVLGFNLADRHVKALQGWVEQGGTLVGIAGTGMSDEYNDPSGATAELFGASQRKAGVSTGGWHPQSLPEHAPIDTIKVSESAVTPAMVAEVIGVKVALTPTTGKAVATFKDGSPAAVTRELGKGRTLLWGVMPGHMFKGDAKGGNRYRLDRATLVTKPALASLTGDAIPRVTCSDPQVETCLFEHETGLAVTLNEVAVGREPAPKPAAGDAPAPSDPNQLKVDASQVAEPGKAEPAKTKAKQTITITVRTARPIKDARSSFAGPLEFKREGDEVRVTMPLPEPVDVLILR